MEAGKMEKRERRRTRERVGLTHLYCTTLACPLVFNLFLLPVVNSVVINRWMYPSRKSSSHHDLCHFSVLINADIPRIQCVTYHACLITSQLSQRQQITLLLDERQSASNLHIFVYKTLTKRNEIARKSRNYDKKWKCKSWIVNMRQYASYLLTHLLIIQIFMQESWQWSPVWRYHAVRLSRPTRIVQVYICICKTTAGVAKCIYSTNLSHSRQNCCLTYLFHAQIAYPTLSFVWSRMTAAVSYEWDKYNSTSASWASYKYILKPRPGMRLVAVQLVACLGELYCLGNKLLKVEHVQHCATCRQVRLFVAQTGNLLRRQVAHSVQTCNLLPATSCMSGRGFRTPYVLALGITFLLTSMFSASSLSVFLSPFFCLRDNLWTATLKILHEHGCSQWKFSD